MPVSRRTAAGGGFGLLLAVVLAMVFGVDPSLLLGLNSEPGSNAGAQSSSGLPSSAQPLPGQAGRQSPALPGGREDELASFASFGLADAEDTWNAILRQDGANHRESKLVLFSDHVRSACGLTGSAIGPFYCPADEKIYIDLSFYDELQSKFRAPGDFAQGRTVSPMVAANNLYAGSAPDSPMATHKPAIASRPQACG
ncbi:MAG: hypothetical protein N838_15615 [Thiohalocapsa sp. PB-PSB1]|nr:MAG: hypothetical protein N838_15615 [Thiohalocapsa sp. PB-PSB1]